MAKKETETRERLPYVQRYTVMVERTIKSLTRARNAAERSEQTAVASAASALISACKPFIDSLAKLPKDFAPSGNVRVSAAALLVAGDSVQVTENWKNLYGPGNLKDLTVQEVIRVGGNKQGRGSKLFVKCKNKSGSLVTGPANHFEIS